MTVDYDSALPRFLQVLTSSEMWTDALSPLVVRTLRGQLRLAWRSQAPPAGCRAMIQRLEAELEQSLEGWYAGPMICTWDGPPGMRRVAEALFAQQDQLTAQIRDWRDRWPLGWPTELLPVTPGEPRVSLVNRIEAQQVALGKEAWVRAEPGVAPWRMLGREPRITAFHGFKGGAGRTTTLAILAWRLAAQGRRVLCVDLDLEAPGLYRYLNPDTEPSRGVLDYLLAHAVTGDGGALPVEALSVHGRSLWVAPAGRLGDLYLEKLSRLDTVHHRVAPVAAPAGADPTEPTDQSPVHRALSSFLKQARQGLPGGVGRPDHIFLDCRAGLHDLAGLALNDIAHVNVFAGRGTPQELEGLGPLLTRLSRRRQDDPCLVFLRTFAETGEGEDARLAQHRAALYDRLAECLPGYTPSPGDLDVPHDPLPIFDSPSIRRARSLDGIRETELNDSCYTKVLDRLGALWTPPP